MTTSYPTRYDKSVQEFYKPLFDAQIANRMVGSDKLSTKPTDFSRSVSYKQVEHKEFDKDFVAAKYRDTMPHTEDEKRELRLEQLQYAREENRAVKLKAAEQQRNRFFTDPYTEKTKEEEYQYRVVESFNTEGYYPKYTNRN